MNESKIFSREKILLLVFTLSFLIFVGISFSPASSFLPTTCQDSDGDCNVANINTSDGNFEMVDLLTFPYGWINANNFIDSIPSQNTIDNASIHVRWKTDVGFGATNIKIEFWNGSIWNNCAGPLGENETTTETVCDISYLSKEQILNIKIRFRGEDNDGFPNAFAYVDLMKVEVNHSAPPLWDNQTTNVSTGIIYPNNPIRLAVQTFDDVGLAYAWLSTNETGEWKNYTDGTYNSPINLNGLSEAWTWANFSWKNNSFLSGTVGWKIFINDTTGKENVTDVKTFFVQFRKLPTSCQDSDGDCNVANINTSDGNFEMVDLLTFPYGWINAISWDINIPDNTVITRTYLHVIWYTDTGWGASNINVDYWSGSSWINCAGPFLENATVSDTSCNVSSLSTAQLNSIKIRFRGEDNDGFPNAFAYVDRIYIEANYTIGIPYLEVNLVFPNASAPTNLIQNNTFTVNSTVYCRVADCGNVNATVKYNLTSTNPETPINTTQGDKPFFIQESPALAMKSCPTNPLEKDEFCNITWIVNATGDVNTNWKIGVVFNSSSSNVIQNHTDNATVSIVSCSVDFSLKWSSLKFGLLNPSTGPNEAPGNSNKEYNVSVNSGSCNLDFYINGTNLENTEFNSYIGAGNVTWSNTSNTYSESFNLSSSITALKLNIPEKTNLTTWYWINVPPVYSGYYNGTIYIYGVENGQSSP